MNVGIGVGKVDQTINSVLDCGRKFIEEDCFWSGVGSHILSPVLQSVTVRGVNKECTMSVGRMEVGKPYKARVVTVVGEAIMQVVPLVRG